jgi:hypothetical protein
MKELKAILESELLNDETKAALTEAVANLKEAARKEVEVEYANKLVAKSQEMAELLPKLVEEAVAQEIEGLKDDIEKYKRLEVSYAEKLAEFKENYAIKMSKKLRSLVEGTVKDEVSELKDDLMEVKQIRIGKRIFEALKQEMAEFGITETEKELKDALVAANAKLEESTTEILELKREKIVEGLLNKLTGSKREVMKSILEGVATEKLETRFDESIEQVLEGAKKVEDLKTGPKKTVTEGLSDEDLRELKVLSGQI